MGSCRGWTGPRPWSGSPRRALRASSSRRSSTGGHSSMPPAADRHRGRGGGDSRPREPPHAGGSRRAGGSLVRLARARDAVLDETAAREPMALRRAHRPPARGDAHNGRDSADHDGRDDLRGWSQRQRAAGPGRAVVNFRIKPGNSVGDVLAHVKKVVGDRRVRIELLASSTARDPSPVSRTGSEGFETIARTIRQVLPARHRRPSLVLAATDTRHYEDLADDVYRFLPYIVGPEDTPRIHGTDERIGVRVYRDCIRFYAQLLINESHAANEIRRNTDRKGRNRSAASNSLQQPGFKSDCLPRSTPVACSGGEVTHVRGWLAHLPRVRHA